MNRRIARWGLGALCCAVVSWGAAWAQSGDGVTGYAELTAANIKVDNRPADGTPLLTETDSLLQRYNLGFHRRLWPNLRLRFGGLFEVDETDSQPGDLETATRRVRPYLGIGLRTPDYLADLSFDRNEQRFESEGQEVSTIIRETLSGTLGYSPRSGPNLRLQLFHTDDYDEGRELTDRSENLAQLIGRYQIFPQLRVQYRGSVSDRDDRLETSSIRSVNHSARLTYDQAFLERRVAVHSNYEIAYRAAETETRERGEIRFPILLLSGGLSALDDTPFDGALDPNAALIDDNLTTSAGIDIGFEPPSGDRRLRNLGLDFGVETRVNALLVTIDRELPASEVADRFVWEVFVSTDNLRWTSRGVVTSSGGASFDLLQRRFEIRFNDSFARYVKLVVAPLESDPRNRFPDIFVTELAAEERRELPGGREVLRATSHVFNVDVRSQLTTTPTLFHEFNYLYNKVGDAQSRWLSSNGLALLQPIGPTLLLAARVAREEGRDRAGDRSGWVYSASLASTALPTVRQTLIFSGRDEEILAVQNRQHSVLYSATAEIYRGIDLNLGLGKGYTKVGDVPTVESTQVNTILSLTPNPKLGINLVYQKSEDALGAAPETELPNRLVTAREVNLSLRPLTTLYLFGSYRLERRAGEQDRRLNNYSVSWLPFPDGNLHFNFEYTESVRSELDAQERQLSPSLRWDITRRAYLNLAYVDQQLDTDQGRIQTEIVSGTVRIAF